jgi:two-component system, OmpR family, response regulator
MMGKGRIVVIENDGWIARLLEEGLRAADYDVLVASDALDGFRRVCEVQPDCIVCDVALPDFDGQWVARSVRSHASAISKVPLLFLSNADDERSPLGASSGGADAHLSKPFRLEEVVGQVAALIEMAKRLGEAQPPAVIEKAPPPGGEALRGSLEQMSVATVLSLLELERRTGQLKVSSSGAEATIELVRGFAVTSTLRGVSTPLLATVRELLNWNKGLVSFYVGKDVPEPEKKRPIGALLMEAAQLNATGPTPAPSVPRVARPPTPALAPKTPPKPIKR